MANKQKKKRNKVYRGSEAALDRPVITRISAVHRSRLGQWWFDHKRIAKPVIIATIVVVVVVWLIFELTRIVSGL
jgi:hypothetical protein